MGRLVNGEWRDDPHRSTEESGEYNREPTVFHHTIREDGPFTPDKDRYHLYISRACPWAHGAALVRSVLGVTDHISMDVVDWYRDAHGWEFTPEKPGCTPDSIHGYEYLHELYTHADPTYTGRVTVPVLWDTEQDTIVNNESVQIMRMLTSEFTPQRTGVELYPPARRNDIDELITMLYDAVNNGVYRAGFATTQDAYDNAVSSVFSGLDSIESTLQSSRFLLGDSLTLADLRLFPTLIRFDPVYHTHFKCTKHRIVDYPNLWNYTKDLYQRPRIQQTVNFEHITKHYYQTHTSINPTQIVPLFPASDLTEDHNRDQF